MFNLLSWYWCCVKRSQFVCSLYFYPPCICFVFSLKWGFAVKYPPHLPGASNIQRTHTRGKWAQTTRKENMWDQKFGAQVLGGPCRLWLLCARFGQLPTVNKQEAKNMDWLLLKISFSRNDNRLSNVHDKKAGKKGSTDGLTSVWLNKGFIFWWSWVWQSGTMKEWHVEQGERAAPLQLPAVPSGPRFLGVPANIPHIWETITNMPQICLQVVIILVWQNCST